MRIPVKNEENKTFFLEIDDILYLSTHDRKITIVTSEGNYYPIELLQDYFSLLKQAGFDHLDRDNIVQLKKIIRYDRKQFLACFENDECITVSRPNRHKVRYLR